MSPPKTGECLRAPASPRVSTGIKSILTALLLTVCSLAAAPSGATTSETDLTWVTAVVKSGDTLSAIADRHKIGPSELHRIVNSGKDAKKLARLRPGDEIEFAFDGENSVQRISKRIDEETRLLVERTVDGFSASTVSEPLERRVQYASGIINHSLFGAANEAGISSGIIMELAGLFGWDVDFGLDVRTGDQFSVVYETLYRNGDFVRDGKIIAAEFINRGERYRALRYTNPEGATDYYSPDGATLRKAFLRSPVDFARISSGFNLKRKHPILHTIRAHKGVDYAAKTGTPIRSTGDGKVVHRGSKGGYGRTIIIQHGSRYSTLYAHMSKYASKAKLGSRVKQGQIIGYIGSSGLATGPHLHYEFRADGVHRNPLSFKFPRCCPCRQKVSRRL
ncbi:MAG: peptidoglycan DD-metalloendopeptidase family protein [Pseudomonadota bacterium]